MDAKLAAVIVHDIKNALSVLEGDLQRLTIEPTRTQALSAHETCVSLRDKMIGFLTLYKAASQGLTTHIDAISPQDFLNALIRNRLTSRQDIRIAVSPDDMPVLAFFDEHLVGLALEAALQNATRFARATIEVGCHKQDNGDLVFTVRDDGAGLGAQEAKPSTGLGMELCRAIAEAHCKGGNKGSATLADHPQGGALFTLRLP